MLKQNSHEQYVGEDLKNDFKEHKTQIQTTLYQVSQAWD